MKDERGFTLIELMIVVSIIAILAAILIPNFVHARAQAQTAACESNLRSIATAAELYYTDNQNYPPSGAVTSASFGPSYLSNTPQDPAATSPGANYSIAVNNANGTPSYVITCPGTHDPSTLSKILNASGATHTLTYTSGQGLKAQ